MDGAELFGKIGVGAKFNFCKFETDARKFKLIKNVDTAPVGLENRWKASNANSSKLENQRERNGLLKCSANPDSKECIWKDESEIDLLGISEQKTKKTWLQRKRTQKLSLEKLVKIRKEEISHFRKTHHIYVYGTDIPDPIRSFDDLSKEYGLCSSVLENITKLGYSTPTSIQMQVIPLMLHRRELLACAPTGSGKTAAFLVPIIQHLKEPQNLGFRAIVISPTRELAKQIYQECIRLSNGSTLKIRLINKVSTAAKKFGPNSTKKCDILITTPKRLVYMLQQDPPLICLKSVEWLIIDESDKLFEAGKRGFCDQLAVIYKACSSVNVRRAMFSATYTHEVEEWCKLNLDSVITVSIGVRNSVVDSVKQELLFVGNESGKLLAFRDLVKKGLTPPVLVFVQSKERSKELFSELVYDGINADVIHADRTQLQRDNVVKSFRSGNIWVLICTELMGRGIDFKGVNLVVNYDFPPTTISYIHRIGRTGRAGRPGHAITYFTEEDVGNLRSIAQVMKNSGCEVPEYMLKLKKPKKRKNVSSVPIKRKKISTKSDYDIEIKAKKLEFVKNSKRKKLQNLKK